MRRLDALSDERAYQVLDYVEFLESRYAERPAAAPSLLQRFAEGVEDTLRAGNVSATAVAETMGLLGKAVQVLAGVAQGARSVVEGVATPGGAQEAAPADAAAAPPPPNEPTRPQAY